MLGAEIGWGQVSAALVVLLTVGGGLGAVLFKARQVVRQLTKEASDAQADGYRSLYEIEKERVAQLGRDLADLRQLVEQLRSDVRRGDEEVRFVRDENRKLVELNIKWQETVRQKDHEIQTLRDTVRRQQDAIDVMERR